ncbi:MAG: PBP1A family penicillin-binding protein [Nodosilinea sp. LVE1205-7]
MIEAFIAAEDQRFYQHQGVDAHGIGRAVWANLRQRDVVEGASTITQQLARIVYLNQDRNFQRKAKEMLMAYKLEKNLNKNQIMERYLNLVYLGSGAYGVADAAWVYFGKTMNQLTVAEMAMIAGMAPAPSRYSPVVNPQAAEGQRNRVIRQMLTTQAITAPEAEAAIATPIQIQPKQPKFLYSQFPYFTIYVQNQLEQVLSPEQLAAGGLTVETTLNVNWQRKADKTVNQAIEQYSRWQGIDQVALTAVDPRSGEIKAMVGGNDFTKTQFNRATQAQRQPGSTFKTFVYTAAIAAGISPYKEYTDAAYVVDGYQPENYDEKYRGKINLLEALRHSVNVVAVKLLIDVGFDPVVKIAKAMGIESPLLPAYSLALGSSEVNLLELTSAYGTLANQGRHVSAHGIRRVWNSQGKVLYQAPKQSTQAVDQGTAAIMTWMLQGVVQGGTGTGAALGRPVAGKTGTSEKNRDLWFIGYIPQLVAGVWMGRDDSRPTRGASGTAAAIWRQFMAQLTDDIPVEKFPELPRLAGRKGSIKAEPIKPVQVSSEPPVDATKNTQSSPESKDSSTPPTNSGSPSDSTVPNPTPAPAPSPVSPPASQPPVAPEPPRQNTPAPAPPPVLSPAPPPRRQPP